MNKASSRETNLYLGYVPKAYRQEIQQPQF